jgi:hypothetical protein
LPMDRASTRIKRFCGRAPRKKNRPTSGTSLRTRALGGRGARENPCGSLRLADASRRGSPRTRRPLATRAASSQRWLPGSAVTTPHGDADRNPSCRYQGAPAERRSIVCLGDNRLPGAIVVARRSIRRALNRQIRDSVSNPAIDFESFFNAHPRTRLRCRLCNVDEPRAPCPRVPSRKTAVTHSGPMT